MTENVKFYCSNCDKKQPVIIEPLAADELNGDEIWGDIVCQDEGCHLVIATISADEPGEYVFLKRGTFAMIGETTIRPEFPINYEELQEE